MQQFDLNSDVKRSYTVTEAKHLSGLSVFMLNYLCREKILVPTILRPRGRGKLRRYSFSDVVMLRALGRLLDAGISVRKLKSALHRMTKLRDQITPQSLPATHLVTDGKEVYFRAAESLLSLPSGQITFAFVLELAPVRDEVIRKHSKLFADPQVRSPRVAARSSRR